VLQVDRKNISLLCQNILQINKIVFIFAYNASYIFNFKNSVQIPSFYIYKAAYRYLVSRSKEEPERSIL